MLRVFALDKGRYVPTKLFDALVGFPLASHPPFNSHALVGPQLCMYDSTLCHAHATTRAASANASCHRAAIVSHTARGPRLRPSPTLCSGTVVCRRPLTYKSRLVMLDRHVGIVGEVLQRTTPHWDKSAASKAITTAKRLAVARPAALKHGKRSSSIQPSLH